MRGTYYATESEISFYNTNEIYYKSRGSINSNHVRFIALQPELAELAANKEQKQSEFCVDINTIIPEREWAAGQ